MGSPAGRSFKTGDDNGFLILALGAGVALRLLWLARTSSGLTGLAPGGEAGRAALSMARDGTFGDVFWAGSGPTAHLMPVAPAFAALVFRLFPPDGAAASLILLAWSLAQTLAAILLLRRLFARLGADPRALRWATAMLLLLPVYAPEETIGYRYWDGALAVCLSAANLLAALRVERDGALSMRTALTAAVLWALTAFTNPIAGVALALVWAWVALRRLALPQAARFALLSALALATVLTPWTLRNTRALGRPVLLRSNFGLEFAIANHPAALSDRAPELVYRDRLAAIHPFHGPSGRQALIRAGGEVAYSRALGAETWRWAVAHPGDSAHLALRHLGQFLVPPPWTMLLSSWEELMPARVALIALMNLLGIAAIAVGIRRRRPGYVLLAIFVAAVALPYALVQPNPRYTYLVWGLLAFAAWDGAVRFATYRPGAG